MVWMAFQLFKRFCWWSEEKCARTHQTGKYATAINASSMHCLNESSLTLKENLLLPWGNLVTVEWCIHRARRVTHLTHAGWEVWWWRVDSAEEQQRCSPSVRALRGFVRLLEFYTWSSNSLSCHHVCTKPMESCRCQRFWCHHHFNLANNHWSAPLLPLGFL